MRPEDDDVDLEEADAWLRSEVVPAYDALKADPSRAIPARDVRAEFEGKWRQRSQQERAEAAAALRATGQKLDERLRLSEAEVEEALKDFERLRKSGQ